jgi:hypothetical protein
MALSPATAARLTEPDALMLERLETEVDGLLVDRFDGGPQFTFQLDDSFAWPSEKVMGILRGRYVAAGWRDVEWLIDGDTFAITLHPPG